MDPAGVMALTPGNVRHDVTMWQRGALAQQPHLSALPTSPVLALPPQTMNNEPQMELTTAVKPVLAPKPAMPHPCPPPDLTAAAIASAKGAELQHWINQANWQAAGGKQVLKKAGCINELQEWLAQYYGLKLNGSPAKTGLQATASDAPPPAAHSPSGNHVPAINADIQQCQWEHLVALGDEWAIAGDSFQLCQQPGEFPHISLAQTATSISPSSLLN